jgi:DNA-directed RNA polymerase subunit RPC12/RpoP
VVATSEPVETARRSKACPRCGSRAIAKIQYGEPAYSRQLEADLEAHRVILGGCMVWDDQPDLTCAACGLEFRVDGRPSVPDPTS